MLRRRHRWARRARLPGQVIYILSEAAVKFKQLRQLLQQQEGAVGAIKREVRTRAKREVVGDPASASSSRRASKRVKKEATSAAKSEGGAEGGGYCELCGELRSILETASVCMFECKRCQRCTCGLCGAMYHKLCEDCESG